MRQLLRSLRDGAVALHRSGPGPYHAAACGSSTRFDSRTGQSAGVRVQSSESGKFATGDIVSERLEDGFIASGGESDVVPTGHNQGVLIMSDEIEVDEWQRNREMIAEHFAPFVKALERLQMRPWYFPEAGKVAPDRRTVARLCIAVIDMWDIVLSNVGLDLSRLARSQPSEMSRLKPSPHFDLVLYGDHSTAFLLLGWVPAWNRLDGPLKERPDDLDFELGRAFVRFFDLCLGLIPNGAADICDRSKSALVHMLRSFPEMMDTYQSEAEHRYFGDGLLAEIRKLAEWA